MRRDREATTAYNKAYYKANREKLLSANKVWHERNAEKAKARSQRQSAMRSAMRAALRAQKTVDLVAVAEQRRIRTLEYMREYLKRNPEKAKAWAAQSNRKRAGAKYQHRPKWANMFFIEEVYGLCKLRDETTGIKWNVDHIVPIKSATVCGLHSEQNLAVIPSRLNASKGNRYWPDMP